MNMSRPTHKSRTIAACLLTGCCSAAAVASASPLCVRPAFVPVAKMGSSTRTRRIRTPFKHPASSTDGGADSPTPKKKKRKEKKPKFVINPNLVSPDGTVASISSDGILADRIKEREAKPAVKSNLGVSSKRRTKDKKQDGTNGDKKLSAKAAKIKSQRTAGGTVDSSTATILSAPPSEQNVQIQVAKRGNKSVTMVRGLTSPMDERKKLLKEMKGNLGVGGTLVEGVLELQGSHADKILALLKKKGFAKAKVVGK